jgi:hypothetical protein
MDIQHVRYHDAVSMPHSFLQFSGVVEDANRVATATAQEFSELLK